MGLTLGITGMDRATEAQLREAFESASAALGGRWQLAAEADADYVVVDMDSMYGPMSWIRLHAAGKQVVALTTSARTQADYLLPQPVEAGSLAALLRSIDGVAETASPAEASAAPPPPPTHATPADLSPEASGFAVSDTDATAPARSAPPAASVAVPMAAAAAPPSSATPAPAPADELPEERPAPPGEEAAAPPEPAAAIEPAAPPPARDATLADWLAPGALSGRWRFDRDGVAFVFDADARTYHGSATLKPMAPAFAHPLQREELQSVAPSDWAEAAATLGAAQPLSRLQWLGGLLAGGGALLPGLDAAGRYRLVKWPQTEREYPKHFRLATAMMKGPTTVAGLAAASGVGESEAADFVNANLATGYAEHVPEPGPEPVEPPRPTGLFGRIRGR